MPQRNGQRSRNGRSATARRVLFSGPGSTDGMYVNTNNGGGVKKGASYGITDDFGFAGVDERTSVHDLHATILHLMGFEHEKFTYEFQGRPFRLTDVHGELIHRILA